MPKSDTIVLVSGATGQQGGATAARLIADGWPVRVLTRNPESAAATALRHAGAEIVAGDMDDRGSLDAALRGVYGVRAGSGCLNNNSASISGASAGVRPPRGAEENRSRLDPGCGRQGSNAVVARCKSRDIDQSSFAPHRRFRRLADRPPRI